MTRSSRVPVGGHCGTLVADNKATAGQVCLMVESVLVNRGARGRKVFRRPNPPTLIVTTGTGSRTTTHDRTPPQYMAQSRFAGPPSGRSAHRSPDGRHDFAWTRLRAT